MSRKWIPLWVWPCLIAFAIGTVTLRLWIVDTTYAINHTNQMIQNTSQEKERFELGNAKLRSPRRLELLARSRFRLKPPSSEQVIYMND